MNVGRGWMMAGSRHKFVGNKSVEGVTMARRTEN